jgi:hypothetical protein
LSQNPPVSKTVSGLWVRRGFKSLPLRFLSRIPKNHAGFGMRPSAGRSRFRVTSARRAVEPHLTGRCGNGPGSRRQGCARGFTPEPLRTGWSGLKSSAAKPVRRRSDGVGRTGGRRSGRTCRRAARRAPWSGSGHAYALGVSAGVCFGGREIGVGSRLAAVLVPSLKAIFSLLPAHLQGQPGQAGLGRR